MNPRLALYLSATAFVERTIHLRGGRRVLVICRRRRRRMIARAALAAGISARRVARALKCPERVIARALSPLVPEERIDQ